MHQFKICATKRMFNYKALQLRINLETVNIVCYIIFLNVQYATPSPNHVNLTLHSGIQLMWVYVIICLIWSFILISPKPSWLFLQSATQKVCLANVINWLILSVCLCPVVITLNGANCKIIYHLRVELLFLWFVLPIIGGQ